MASMLTNEDVADLIFLFHEYESRIGLRSTWNDSAEVKRTHEFSGQPTHDPFDDDCLDAIKRGSRITRTLRRMSESGHNKCAIILYRVYGDLHRGSPFGVFGELAQIVQYTNRVEMLASVERRTSLKERFPSLDDLQVAKIAPRFPLPTQDALESRLNDKPFVSSVRAEAKRLLRDAAEAYLNAKEELDNESR